MQNKIFFDHKIAFCDSLEAIEIAKKSGLPEDCLIKTSSPAVLLDKAHKTVQVDSHWDLNKFKRLDSSVYSFVNKVYKETSLHPDIASFAHAIARFSFNFPLFIYKASCIEKDDLLEKRIIIEIEHTNKKINAPWKILLANNRNAEYIKIKCNANNDTLEASKIPFFDRVRIGGLESIFYKLSTSSFSMLPNFFFKGDIFVSKGNELITEVCFELIKKRYRIREIKPVKFEVKVLDDEFENIKKVLNKIIDEFIKTQVITELVDVCRDYYFQELKDFLDSFVSLKFGWRETLIKTPVSNNIIFNNSPSSIQGISLFESSRDNDLIISAQHGVTDEISKTAKKGMVAMEVNASDLFLAYNEEEVIASNKSAFKKGKSVAVGMSIKHLRMSQNYSFFESTCPIVYVATDLYRGNNGHGGRLTDFDKAQSEIAFIENVLAKLPHKVLYKPYPEQNVRYPDINPIFDAVDKTKNIDLYEKKVDMRYLIMRHKVIITSSATSTVSWPMLSLKPMIFINSQKRAPLNKEAYASFKKGVFMFDEEHPDFYRKILELLTLPISEIEYLSNKMSFERNKTIKSFFTKYNGGAGKRSLRLLEKNLGQKF